MTWVIDAILAAVLVGLVWLGAKRGLMKSLAGVISVGAAFFGASWCANRFVTPVSRWLEPLLREMHPEDGYALILAILAYARCGTPPQFSSAALNYAWAFVRAGIDRDDARYCHVVEQRRKAAEKRWSKRTDASNEDTFAALACK